MQTVSAPALLAGTLLPVAGALAAGAALGGDDDFNPAAGVAAGLVLAACAVVVLLPRPAAEEDPEVAAFGGARPEPGATVRVRAHFGPAGGYVEHDGLLLWATPAPGTDGLAPGALCRVRTAGGELTVTRA
ncbi:hypothetical protein [Paractinoplanes atraurantiacus]|uniref:NfeD-like C-terminal, partner-binding n=1 Tax=Paractinoplanes atraurantiacus TaxID=1036182 RepID=A0A285KA62_9ACTN|nr:hypothetical protein [Actinoplanes atraurantiacus]SNY69514.1 hypothetical protein SAMN05421748_13562 [Actinoplanes atraurantiacus]